MRGTAVLGALVLTACGLTEDVPVSSTRPFASAEDGFSALHPDGWEASRVQGAIRFVPQRGAKAKTRAKHTIVVRSTDKLRELHQGRPTSSDDIFAATERALRGMPRARVARGGHATKAPLPAAQFSVTYVPSSVARQYRREHVVLVGDRRLFHVMYTAPAGESIDEAAFRTLVTSLQEGA